MSAEASSLGAWESERSAIAQAPYSTAGQSAALKDVPKFSLRVAAAVHAQSKATVADKSSRSVFVLVPPSKHRELKAAGLEFSLGMQSGEVDLRGRIHFVTESVGSTCSGPCPVSDDQLVERLEVFGLAAAPTIIYRPAATSWQLTLHAEGLQGNEMSQVHVNDGNVSDQAIFQALEAFWEEHLITPDAIQKGQRRFWEDSIKGHPIPDTESAIQQFVHVGLTMRFWWCRVRQEQTGKIGRTDLEIVETTALQGQTVHHAVLELKVLRSFDSSGNKVSHAANAGAITKGLSQAEEYGNDKNTTHKILSCFDMRDIDVGQAKTFEHIAEEAAKLQVHTWQWFMYRSSDDLRKARTAATLAAISSGS